MTCMSSMPVLPSCATSVVGAILGFSAAGDTATPSCMKRCLASSSAVRSCAAKLLSKAVAGDALTGYLSRDGELAMKGLSKLTTDISLDGKRNLEGLHDMLYVLYQISQSMPDPLCNNADETLMNMLVSLSRCPIEDAQTFYAKGVIATLNQRHRCHKFIKILSERMDSANGANAEDQLRAN